MKVAVVGLWHLGPVTAVALAELGHEVIVHDRSPHVVAVLEAGDLPVAEPGLAEALQIHVAAGRIRVARSMEAAVDGVDVVWIGADTPVDAADRPDVAHVVDLARAAVLATTGPVGLVVSSQVPVGTTADLCDWARRRKLGLTASAHVPENLRLGAAVGRLFRDEPTIVGVDDPASHEVLRELLPAEPPILWMSTRSAELAKAARNAHLAASVALANEIGDLAEATGADGDDVAKALRLDPRIGRHAYVRAGSAFSGATLARDVRSLIDVAAQRSVPAIVLRAITASNDHHRTWARRALERAWPDPTSQRVAVLGLTYKAGTSTLRRSWAVELANDLARSGAEVRAYEPSVEIDDGQHPDLDPTVRVVTSALAAVQGASAVVVGNQLDDVAITAVLAHASATERITIVDPDGWCRPPDGTAGITYLSVGRSRVPADDR